MMESAEAAVRKPRGRPARRVEETPEFRDALEQAKQELKADILGQLQQARGEVRPHPMAGDGNFAEALALAIAGLTNQGVGHRPVVAPEVISARNLARQRMQQLIIEARAEGRVATYQLRNKVLLGNRVIEPMWIDAAHVTRPTEIDFGGVPNEAMIPLNDTAKEIHAAFMASIGSVSKEVPDQVSEVLGITAGGVVVRNGAVNAAASRRAVATPGAGYEENADEVTVHHAGEPGRTKPVNILGTIHAPARQTV